MQLKIQRSQRTGGVMSSTVFFCLDVRADYTSEEQNNISRYKLGAQGIYNSHAARRHLDTAGAHLETTQVGSVGERAAGLARGAMSLALSKLHLNITIDSLGRGQHIECKDLEELLEAQEAVRTACKNVTRYLQIAATFNGSQTVIDYDGGEEKIHVTQVASPLLTYEATESGATEPHPVEEWERTATYGTPAFDAERALREFWNNPQNRKFTVIGGGIVVLLFLLRSCF
jgi:hypothetical protein